MIDKTALLFGNVNIGEGTIIERGAMIGKQDTQNDMKMRAAVIGGKKWVPTLRTTIIGRRNHISAECIIFEGVIFGDDVELEERIRVGYNTSIGDRSRLMYEGLIYNRVRIGSDCNVAGFICNDTEIGNCVSFYGSTVHRYGEHIAPQSWKRSLTKKMHERPSSPTIGDNVVVGFGAVIVGNIEIGEGAVIGPNVVVERDVRPYEKIVWGSYV